jgi:hypothetical protein
MQRTFEADTREEANRQADEWWAKAKGLRFIHRSQIPAGFCSIPHKRWVISIHYKEEGSSQGVHRSNVMRKLELFVDLIRIQSALAIAFIVSVAWLGALTFALLD